MVKCQCMLGESCEMSPNGQQMIDKVGKMSVAKPYINAVKNRCNSDPTTIMSPIDDMRPQRLSCRLSDTARASSAEMSVEPASLGSFRQMQIHSARHANKKVGWPGLELRT